MYCVVIYILQFILYTKTLLVSEGVTIFTIGVTLFPGHLVSKACFGCVETKNGANRTKQTSFHGRHYSDVLRTLMFNTFVAWNDTKLLQSMKLLDYKIERGHDSYRIINRSIRITSTAVDRDQKY